MERWRADTGSLGTERDGLVWLAYPAFLRSWDPSDEVGVLRVSLAGPGSVSSQHAVVLLGNVIRRQPQESSDSRSDHELRLGWAGFQLEAHLGRLVRSSQIAGAHGWGRPIARSRATVLEPTSSRLVATRRDRTGCKSAPGRFFSRHAASASRIRSPLVDHIGERRSNQS